MSPEQLLLYKEDYVTFRADPDNDDTTDGMWCGQLGLPPQLMAEIRKAWPALDFDVLQARRAAYAKLLGQVDDGLFKKAIAGDAKAADLVYRRFENWSPKQAEEQAKATGGGKSKTFAELIAEGE